MRQPPAPLRRAAFFVCSVQMRFALLTERGTLDTTTCPHRASLFTSREMADHVRDQAERAQPDVFWAVFPTATWEPSIITGGPQ